MQPRTSRRLSVTQAGYDMYEFEMSLTFRSSFTFPQGLCRENIVVQKDVVFEPRFVSHVVSQVCLKQFARAGHDAWDMFFSLPSAFIS